jgi:hypothetical protein
MVHEPRIQIGTRVRHKDRLYLSTNAIHSRNLKNAQSLYAGHLAREFCSSGGHFRTINTVRCARVQSSAGGIYIGNCGDACCCLPTLPAHTPESCDH